MKNIFFPLKMTHHSNEHFSKVLRPLQQIIHLEFESAMRKNLWIFFQKYGFIRKIEPFHLRMKHNIIQMTATDGLTVPYSINTIFQYIFDCLSFNSMNGNFDLVFQDFNRLWMVSVTLILNGSPQKTFERGQITALRRPIDIRISADYSIFKNGAQKIDCYVGSVSSGPALLKSNVIHVVIRPAIEENEIL